MAVEIQGKVGPQLATDGNIIDPRLLRDGTAAVADADGHFSELVLRGQVYTVATAAVGITLASTHASPLAAGSGTPIVGVYNPVNSGVVLKILRARVQTVSGTPGGPFVWNTIAAPAAISAAGQQGLNNKTFVSGGSAKAFIGGALTGSVIASVFAAMGGPAAVAAGAGVYSVDDLVDGMIQVQPGCFAGVACTAAGTTHIVAASLTWSEAPIAVAA